MLFKNYIGFWANLTCVPLPFPHPLQSSHIIVLHLHEAGKLGETPQDPTREVRNLTMWIIYASKHSSAKRCFCRSWMSLSTPSSWQGITKRAAWRRPLVYPSLIRYRFCNTIFYENDAQQADGHSIIEVVTLASTQTRSNSRPLQISCCQPSQTCIQRQTNIDFWTSCRNS